MESTINDYANVLVITYPMEGVRGKCGEASIVHVGLLFIEGSVTYTSFLNCQGGGVGRSQLGEGGGEKGDKNLPAIHLNETMEILFVVVSIQLMPFPSDKQRNHR